MEELSIVAVSGGTGREGGVVGGGNSDDMIIGIGGKGGVDVQLDAMANDGLEDEEVSDARHVSNSIYCAQILDVHSHIFFLACLLSTKEYLNKEVGDVIVGIGSGASMISESFMSSGQMDKEKEKEASFCLGDNDTVRYSSV